jgi:hypothetical protein
MVTLGERSATIYQFPKGGRAGIAPAREEQRFGDDAPISSRPAVGEAWYHAEAIRAEREQCEQ